MLCSECSIQDTQTLVQCTVCRHSYHQYHMGVLPEDNDNLSEVQREDTPICTYCQRTRTAKEYKDILGVEIDVFNRETEKIRVESIRKINEILRKYKQRNTEGISTVYLEDTKLEPLFSSPYPEEYTKYRDLFICGGCLEYYSSEYTLERHKKKCNRVYPPGRLLYYESEGTAVFEVEGVKNKRYCQSLCLLAKMFLNHKTLYYDVEPFVFYVVGKATEGKFTMHGYFSKERGEGSNNLSCIVILPPYRKAGLGTFLIDLSYHLTKRIDTPPYTAGPEKPLSKEGHRVYLNYWVDTLIRHALFKKRISKDHKYLEEVSLKSGISIESLEEAMKELQRICKTPMVSLTDIREHKEDIKRGRRIKHWSINGESIILEDRKKEKENTTQSQGKEENASETPGKEV
ncbi:hypothetical protein NEOKW01_0813 [Nematocida sp. AWRm80]|nr:hypothetical protein NEOKW01_0813 [Nematocida sp. AWRm80]